MTDEQIEALRVLLAKATPGEWKYFDCRNLNHAWWIGIGEFDTFAEARNGSDYMDKLADSKDNAAAIVALHNAAPAILDALTAARAQIEALTARAEGAEARERAAVAQWDEETAWDATVAGHSLDAFDALAEAWAAREPIVRMFNATTSVFAKWANDELMTRFKAGISGMMQTAFAEGAVCGAHAERHKRGAHTAAQTEVG